MKEYYRRAMSARDILQDRMGKGFYTRIFYIRAENRFYSCFGKWVYYQVDGEDCESVEVIFKKSYTVDEFMNTDVVSFVDRAVLDYTFGVSQ